MVWRLNTYVLTYPLCLIHTHTILMVVHQISMFPNLFPKCPHHLPFQVWSIGIAFPQDLRESTLSVLSKESWEGSFCRLTDDCRLMIYLSDQSGSRTGLFLLFIFNFMYVSVVQIWRTLLETSLRTFTGYPWFGLLQFRLYIVFMNQNKFTLLTKPQNERFKSKALSERTVHWW